MSFDLGDIKNRIVELAGANGRPAIPADQRPRIVSRHPDDARPAPSFFPQPERRPDQVPRTADVVVAEIRDHDVEIMRLCNELLRRGGQREEASEELKAILEVNTAKAHRMLDSSERIREHFFGPRPSVQSDAPQEAAETPQDCADPPPSETNLQAAAG